MGLRHRHTVWEQQLRLSLGKGQSQFFRFACLRKLRVWTEMGFSSPERVSLGSQNAGLFAMDKVNEEPGTILVIEDDQRMQKVLHRIFDEEGYRVVLAGDGLAGVEAFHANDPLAVVLDLVLPQLSGREVCKRIKAARPETPVLVLSAISEVVDKVLLLEFGAEDYITKPFSPRELLARVQAAIRRRRKPALRAAERFGDCEIDFATMSAWKAGKTVVLTAHEFKLLRFPDG